MHMYKPMVFTGRRGRGGELRDPLVSLARGLLSAGRRILGCERLVASQRVRDASNDLHDEGPVAHHEQDRHARRVVPKDERPNQNPVPKTTLRMDTHFEGKDGKPK